MILCGTDIVRETTPDVAADNALFLKRAQKKSNLFYLMPGANAFGAGLLSVENSSLSEIVEAIERGEIKALLLMESDPFWHFPHRQRLEKAIHQLDLLLVMDYLPSTAGLHAHIFLPTLPLFETEARFVNQEGRVQSVERVHPGGIPIGQISRGDHPPRVFGGEIPGSEPKPTGEILAELSQAMSLQGISMEGLGSWLSQENPVFNDLGKSDPPGDGERLVHRQSTSAPFSTDWLVQSRMEKGPGEHLELLTVESTFGTEELSSYSKFIHQVEKAPCLHMNVKDAERLGLNNKDRVSLSMDGGAIEVELCVVENMASGMMFLPRHRQLLWQKLESSPVRVPIENIRRV